jgi:glycosyltransferase domain-containing protein
MKVVDESVASLVTIIIPTVYHRARLFSRALHYLSDSGFNGSIIVSDHSPPECSTTIDDITRKFSGLSVKLLRHAPDEHFLKRLILCASAANTTYIHLHADDDFLVLPTLCRLVYELEHRADCATAMGINTHVWLDSGKYQVLKKTSILQPAPFDRLIAQLESFSSVLYALRRRNEFISSLSFALARCPDVQFWQYLESCASVINGASLVIDELHYVREIHEDKWSATFVRERSLDHFPYLILSPEFQARVGAFRRALVEACEANNVKVNLAALDDGLLHLLSRGLGAVGFPSKQFAVNEPSHETTLEVQLADPNSTAGIEFDRIFNKRLR